MKSKYLAIAFSDPHIGRTWGAHSVPMTREKLTDRYLDPIKEASELAAESRARLLCGGDWFDKAHNSERLIQQSNHLMRSVEVLVAGNHDHAGRASALTSLQLLAGLDEDQEIRVKIAPDHLNTPHADCTFIGEALAVFSVPHHGSQQLFEEALFECERGAATMDGWKVLIIHANLGAPGSGKADCGLYFTPALQDTLEKTFDYILMGHEHLPRRVGKTIVMGSTQPCNFGEIGPRFFYGFYPDNGRLAVDLIPIKTQLVCQEYSAQELIGDGPVKAAELVDIRGKVPVAQAKKIQARVKEFYANGALAVRVDVEFETGTVLDGEAVHSSMRNLVEVVRDELSENKQWTELFDEALNKISGEKV